jgi:hypothetical protein
MSREGDRIPKNACHPFAGAIFRLRSGRTVGIQTFALRSTPVAILGRENQVTAAAYNLWFRITDEALRSLVPSYYLSARVLHGHVKAGHTLSRATPMVKDLSRKDQRQGTRRMMLAGAAMAGALFAGLVGWFAIPHLLETADYLGRPFSGADRNTAATTVGTGVPTQREAQSAVAKNDPAGIEDRTGGRARNIKQSSQPVSLDQKQRDRLRAIFSNAKGPKVGRPNFEMMSGTAVPRQTELADLPPEATEVLKEANISSRGRTWWLWTSTPGGSLPSLLACSDSLRPWYAPARLAFGGTISLICNRADHYRKGGRSEWALPLLQKAPIEFLGTYAYLGASCHLGSIATKGRSQEQLVVAAGPANSCNSAESRFVAASGSTIFLPRPYGPALSTDRSSFSAVASASAAGRHCLSCLCGLSLRHCVIFLQS